MKPFKATYYKENPDGSKTALPTKNWYFQLRLASLLASIEISPPVAGMTMLFVFLF